MAKSYLFINPPVQAVSKWQMYNYAEPYPYGLLKLATMLKGQGHQVNLIDMMVYDHLSPEKMKNWPDNATLHSKKRAGSSAVKDVYRNSYLLGHDLNHLEQELKRYDKPDEIWVTACLTFNWETAHEVISFLKNYYPDVPLKLGGNYPSLLPKHAATSDADEIIEGVIEQAEWLFGDITLFNDSHPVGLFNLATGCSNRCTFCVNHRQKPVLRHKPKHLMYYLLKARKDFGIKHFSNWDPNVMLFPKALEEFLDLFAGINHDLTFAFNMGIQPDKLTANIAEKMMKAGVTQLTIPFETSDPAFMKRYRKPYKTNIPIEKMAMIRKLGFSVGRFHSTAVFAYADETIKYLFRSFISMVLFGAQPDFFPLTPTPGSVEFERLSPVFDGKPYDELNGYLFPVIDSKEKLELYELLIEICNQHYLDRAIKLADKLPAKLERQFFEELEAVHKQLSAFGVPLVYDDK